MTKNKIRTAVNRMPETKILLGLLAVLVVVSAIYIYFIANTVLNVVARKEIQTKISDLNSKTSQIEEKYISMQNKITPEYAKSLGFKEVTAVKFASAKEDRTGLTLGE